LIEIFLDNKDFVKSPKVVEDYIYNLELEEKFLLNAFSDINNLIENENENGNRNRNRNSNSYFDIKSTDLKVKYFDVLDKFKLSIKDSNKVYISINDFDQRLSGKSEYYAEF
jgi:hypothetical protein